MKCLAMIEELKGLIEEGHKLPFAGSKVIVDKEKMFYLINEIETAIPDDIKRTQNILQERQRILIEAQREGEIIIKQAESRISQMVTENEITKQAKERAEELINEAKKTGREIRLGANEYAQDILTKLQENLEKTLEVVRNGKEQLSN